MLRTCLVVCVVMLLAGCGGSDVREVSETRVVTNTPPALPAGHGMGIHPPEGPRMPADPQVSAYTWEVPVGWSDIGAAPMRVGNFKIDSDAGAECYLTVLTGGAGGLDANVNRWRGQMGQASLSAAEIAALPTLEVMGTPSVMVEIEGTFTGMDGQPRPDYLLLGVVCPKGQETLFVKMTGPKTTVGGERERLKAFCLSLKERGTPSDAPTEKGK